MSRVVRRAAVLLAVVLGTVLVDAGTASAHPTLLFTDPAADNAVPDSPPAITLVFNESVTIGSHAITVLDKDNRPVPVGPTTTAQGGRLISARPTGTLPPGTYQVRWQATGADGDQVDEQFAFAVGAAVTVAGTSGGPSISWLDAVPRWILFAGLTIGLGGAVGEWFTATARRENPALPPVRSWTRLGAVAGLLAVAALATVLITGTGSVNAMWQGVPGRLLLAEAGGFLLALLLRREWTIVPLLVIATGTVSALVLVPLALVFSTTYGQVLVVKLGLVAVAASIALTARRVLRRDRLGRVTMLVRVEGGVLVGVLAISGVLVSTPPAGSQPPAPPAPRGPVLLSLRVAGDGWRGGTVSMLIPWPPQPGGDDLARAVRALRGIDRLTLFESVTSDTTTPAPTPQQLALGGAFFADQEPYAAGTAPIAVRISAPSTRSASARSAVSSACVACRIACALCAHMSARSPPNRASSPWNASLTGCESSGRRLSPTGERFRCWSREDREASIKQD